MRPRFACLLFSIIAALGLLIPAVAQASGTLPASGVQSVSPAACGYIGNQWSITPYWGNPKVVEVPGGSSANGVQLDQWTDLGRPWQRWAFYRCDSWPAGYYAIVNANSWKCMNVAGAGTSPGNWVIQYDCGSVPPQSQWALSKGSNTWTEVVNVHSGLCLNVAGDNGDGAQGRKMIQWNCGHPNDLFWIA